MFSEIAPGSNFYGRSRYFLGTVLAQEQDLESAIGEFLRVIEQGGAQEAAVVELAHLALGRLYYETGDYTSATEYYQRITSRSDYFSDQLYELVWTYINRALVTIFSPS